MGSEELDTLVAAGGFLADLEDITHTTPEVIAGSDYGEVMQCMKRPIEDVDG